MATQRVSNERKRELEQIDPFQENVLKAVQYIKDNRKKFILAVCGVVIVAVVFSSVIYSIKAAENNASRLFVTAVNKYSKAASPADGYTSVEADFSELIEKYPNTAAGKMGRVRFAKICYEVSEFDRAYQLYTDALDDFKGDPVMRNLIHTCLGRVSLAKGDLGEAESYFTKVAGKKDPLFKDEAVFNLAMIEEARGNESAARKFYSRILSDFSDSLYTPIAETETAP